MATHCVCHFVENIFIYFVIIVKLNVYQGMLDVFLSNYFFYFWLLCFVKTWPCALIIVVVLSWCITASTLLQIDLAWIWNFARTWNYLLLNRSLLVTKSRAISREAKRGLLSMEDKNVSSRAIYRAIITLCQVFSMCRDSLRMNS